MTLIKNMFLGNSVKDALYLLIPVALFFALLTSFTYMEFTWERHYTGMQRQALLAARNLQQVEAGDYAQAFKGLRRNQRALHYSLIQRGGHLLFNSERGSYKLVDQEKDQWQEYFSQDQDPKFVKHHSELQLTVSVSADLALVVYKKINQSLFKTALFHFLVIYSLLSGPLVYSFVFAERRLQQMLKNARKQLGQIMYAKRLKEEYHGESHGEERLYQQLNKVQKRNYTKVKALKRELGQWEAMSNSLPRGIIAVQNDGSLLFCNERGFNLFGVKARECKGQSLIRVIRNPDLHEFVEKATGEEFFEQEFELILHGVVETLSLTAAPVKLEEQEAMMIVIEKTTRLHQLERIRQEFISNVSHELKTPMTVIAGFTDVLRSTIQDSPEQSLKFLDKIERNVKRMDLIVRDLLTLSKIELDENYMQKGLDKRSINATLRSTIELCSTELERYNVELDLDIPDFTGHKVTANHSLLEQAIRNLIENAVRYSGTGSKVLVKTYRMNKMIHIDVKDDGVGIAAEHQDQVFKRFFRIDPSRDRKTGGSGLGLAIVKHIMRVHGGHVNLVSAEGAGCCFTLVLPVDD